MRYANEDRHVASPADGIKCRVLSLHSPYGEVGSIVTISTSVAKDEIRYGRVEAVGKEGVE